MESFGAVLVVDLSLDARKQSDVVEYATGEMAKGVAAASISLQPSQFLNVMFVNRIRE